MKRTLTAIAAFFRENHDLVESYALIGGLAVGGWGIPRATKDIDLFISLKNTDRVTRQELVRRLNKNGFEGELHKGEITDPVRYCIKTIYTKRKIPVDIIILTRRWEAEVVNTAQNVEIFDGLTIPVASIEGLVVLKLKAGGIQDIADVSKLLLVGEKFDAKRLLQLAKHASVDRNLLRLAGKLGVRLNV